MWGLWWRKLEERKQLGKFKPNWEDNIEMGVEEVGRSGGGDVEWLDLAQDRYKW